MIELRSNVSFDTEFGFVWKKWFYGNGADIRLEIQTFESVRVSNFAHSQLATAFRLYYYTNKKANNYLFRFGIFLFV